MRSLLPSVTGGAAAASVRVLIWRRTPRLTRGPGLCRLPGVRRSLQRSGRGKRRRRRPAGRRPNTFFDIIFEYNVRDFPVILKDFSRAGRHVVDFRRYILIYWRCAPCSQQRHLVRPMRGNYDCVTHRQSKPCRSRQRHPRRQRVWDACARHRPYARWPASGGDCHGAHQHDCARRIYDALRFR